MTPVQSAASVASAANQISRRDFLNVSAAVGGGLVLGVFAPARSARPATADVSDFAPSAFLRIDRSGDVTMTIPQVEMGQGVYTALSMIMADELDADFARVRVEAAPPNDALYKNPLLGFQVTGGSTSIRGFWKPMRKAGAAARALLIAAAADQWQVDPASCRTASGVVFHDGKGLRADYGSLVDAAAKGSPPADPPLKDPKDFTLIGRPIKRLDTPDKVNGKALYGIDARPPGVKIATLVGCPVFGGKVAHVDDKAALEIEGVRQVVVLDDLIAVIGDHMWAAKQGLEALDIEWDEGPNAAVTTAAIRDDLAQAAEQPGAVARHDGDVAKALTASDVIEAKYDVPFLAHAPMEPMNCTVHVRADGCDIWVGNQVISRAQASAAKITGLPLGSVVVHNHLLGGGFGRRLEIDGIEKAVRIAQKVDGPVKVIWTREEDIQKSLYRPMYHDRFAARLENGRIQAWSHRIAGSSVIARWAPPAFVNGLDPDAVDGAIDFPYEFAERARRVCETRAASRSHLLLAQRRPGSQYFRCREFRR